jgi:hypothetical protein
MPNLSDEQREALQKLAARPDHEIDLTDRPEIREIPAHAAIGRFYQPETPIATMRVDRESTRTSGN